MPSCSRTIRSRCAATVAILLLIAAPSVSTQAVPDRVVHWREDLRVLTTAFEKGGYTVDLKRGVSSRGQKDFQSLYPHFREDVDQLAQDVPNLTDSEIDLRIRKIVASAHQLAGRDPVLDAALQAN